MPDYVANDAHKPQIVRIVVDGWTWCSGQEDNVADARRMLVKALKHRDWPSRRARFAVTPGGFVRIPFRFGDIKGGWGSERDFERLLEPSGNAVNRLLTDRVKERLREKARYLTVGVDLNNTDEKASSDTHAELVALVDANSGKIIHWTGKSYPTGPPPPNDQSRTLVQAPVESHCFRKGKQRILILGCHDLHMFGGRGKLSENGQTPKEARRKKMLELAEELEPQVVLHHPHTTYSPRIWGSAWGRLQKTLLPTVAVYASGISFCNKPDCPDKWNCRQTLERTLADTKLGPVIDVVVCGFPCPVEMKWCAQWGKSNSRISR